ncbi:MAG: DinB family protein [Roseiflexaceae bacterium]|nr:DinB family protein [Roseiflexaceae bacterium]
MYDTPRELVEALRATPQTLAALLRDITPEQARHTPDNDGSDEGWVVIEVVCHLRDTEAFVLERMRTLRYAEQPTIGGFDQLAWARDRKYIDADLQAALAAFTQIRAAHAAELATLTAEQWQQIGDHTTIGEVTILNHTSHMVWHDAVHIAQIARQLMSLTNCDNQNL